MDKAAIMQFSKIASRVTTNAQNEWISGPVYTNALVIHSNVNVMIDACL